VAGAVLLSKATLWPHGDAWVVLLLAGAAILWITRHGTNGETTESAGLAAEDSRRIRRVLRGFGIAVGAFVALVLVAAAPFAAVVHVHLGRGVGERTYSVSDVADLRSSYRLGVGDLRLDLSGLTLPRGETHVKSSVDVGKLAVIVPRDAALRVHGDAQFGEVDVLGKSVDGHDVGRNVDEPGARVLVLDTHVGAGALHVTRAVR